LLQRFSGGEIQNPYEIQGEIKPLGSPVIENVSHSQCRYQNGYASTLHSGLGADSTDPMAPASVGEEQSADDISQHQSTLRTSSGLPGAMKDVQLSVISERDSQGCVEASILSSGSETYSTFGVMKCSSLRSSSSEVSDQLLPPREDQVIAAATVSLKGDASL